MITERSSSVVAILVFFASGCVLSGGGMGTSGGGWPVQTYPYACETGLIPNEPVCIDLPSQDGFRHVGEFEACKASLNNFQQGLETHFSCTESKLGDAFDELIRTVPQQLSCYMDYFEEFGEGDPTSACPPIRVPTFHRNYDVRGLEYHLGVPSCVRAAGGHNFAPVRMWQLERCIEQVNVFVHGGQVVAIQTVAPAQTQFDECMRNLRSTVEERADSAVRKFNCLARGESICF